MTAGISTASANQMLDTLGEVYIQMHTADPGLNGTSNMANVSARAPANLPSASAGVRVLTSPIEWTANPWVGANQTVTHVSAWSAATGGSFLFSVALSAQVDFKAGMHPRLNTLSVSIPSLATN